MIFGVDYYPEQWNEKDWREDLKLIKELGAEIVRLCEFAWILFEPKPKEYDFSFFDSILDLMDEFSLKAIIGTPTATFPSHLCSQYPDIGALSADGIRKGMGNRRSASLSSKEYLKAVSDLVTQMAIHYGNRSTVIGWQIDNELGHEGSDLDFSQNSEKKFKKWLKCKYGSIENLNTLWGNIFWGQNFTSFDEIPLPRKTSSTGFNPALIQDFYRFNSDVHIEFIKIQKNCLCKYIKNQFITTNLYPTPFGNILDMTEIFKNLDFVSYDNYPVWGEQKKPQHYSTVSAYLQYVRGLKNRNFTIMEEITGIQGHTSLGYLPPPGQISIWIAQCIANGAEKILFFRYRTARFGQEQLCYGILDHDKKITSRYIEIQKTIKKLKIETINFIKSNYEASICVVHSIENNRSYKHQPILSSLSNKVNSFLDTGYDDEIFKYFEPFPHLGINCHVLPEKSLIPKNYKLVILPLYSMVDENLYDIIDKYVAGGGNLLLTYRTGFKNRDGWAYEDTIPGPFKYLAGVEIREFDCLDKKDLVSLKMNFKTLYGSKICELLNPTTARPLAFYKDKNKFYKNLPAITENIFHKGKVFYLGTSLTNISLIYFYKYILKRIGISYLNLPENLELIHRKALHKNYFFYLNHSNKKIFYDFKIFHPFEFRIEEI